jgi:hypothetical protein
VGVKRVAESRFQERHGREYTLIFHTSNDMDQRYFCKLQILWEPIFAIMVHPRSIYGPPYSSDRVDVIRRFHGSRGVTLHRDLEVTLLRIQRPYVKDAKNDLLINPTSKHFGITIPNFKVSRCFENVISASGCNQYCG